MECHEREEAQEYVTREGVEPREGYGAEAAHGGYWRVEDRGGCVRVEGHVETYHAPVAPGGGREVAEESAGARAYEGAYSACLHWGDKVGRGRTEAHKVLGGTERLL